MQSSSNAELTGLIETYDEDTGWSVVDYLEAVPVHGTSVSHLFGWTLPWATDVPVVYGQPRGWPPLDSMSCELRRLRDERPMRRGVTYLMGSELSVVETEHLNDMYEQLVADVLNIADEHGLQRTRLIVFSTSSCAGTYPETALYDGFTIPDGVNEHPGRTRKVTIDDEDVFEMVEYNDIIENIPGTAVLVFDDTGICTFAAGGVLSELAVRPSDVLDRGAVDLWPNDTGHILSVMIERAVEATPQREELSFSSRTFDVEAIPINHRINTVGVLVVISDISRQDRCIKQFKRVFDAITNAVEGIAIVYEGTCIYADETFSKALGTDVHGMNIGSVWDDYVSVSVIADDTEDIGRESIPVSDKCVDVDMLVQPSDETVVRRGTLEYDDGSVVSSSRIVATFVDETTYIVTPEL